MAEPGGKRKRIRAARACELCRVKKYRCDEKDPCGRCSKLQVDCVYVGAAAFRSRSRPEAQTSFLHPVAGSVDSVTGVIAVDHDESLITWPPLQTHLHNTLEAQAGEITEVNPQTQNQEFHGLTSPLVIIAALQRRIQEKDDRSTQQSQMLQSPSSYLHNETFSSASGPTSVPEPDIHTSSRYYFRQSRCFLDGYFQNLHFIHPFIDQAQFMCRCEALWFATQTDPSRSFVALYFAVMSLGALTREWMEDAIDGKGRLEWARELFHQAATALGTFPVKTDLYSVQASIIMAKVAQNELNPHVAYMYLGLAVRTSLSAGYNREHGASAVASPSASAIAKTWWALYSLEIEMSFALGRTDSLGLDLYHNVSLPKDHSAETGIIGHMVPFARIIRTVAACVYASDLSISKRMDSARGVEIEMKQWIENLPKTIQPQLDEANETQRITKEPIWAKKQRHTLRFRYYNVRMILYMPFLLHVAHTSANAEIDREHLDSAASKCLDAAESTLRLMYHLFCTASYFRTWWYNTTYVLYATSIVFHQAIRFTASPEKSRLLRVIDTSIEMLSVMDEVVVAKKAALLLQQTIDWVRRRDHLGGPDTRPDRRPEDAIPQLVADGNVEDIASTPWLLDWLWDDPLGFSEQTFSSNIHDTHVV